jgi:hypothetical protein
MLKFQKWQHGCYIYDVPIYASYEIWDWKSINTSKGALVVYTSNAMLMCLFIVEHCGLYNEKLPFIFVGEKPQNLLRI